jgi:hypothetical protein
MHTNITSRIVSPELWKGLGSIAAGMLLPVTRLANYLNENVATLISAALGALRMTLL